MLADAERPGFTLALAFTDGGMRLVGFGYGLPRGPVPGSAVDSLPFTAAEPFEFCELVVSPDARGIGAGRALHDAVLAASGPQPRWLVTHLVAIREVGLYQSSGWQIGRGFSGPARGSRLLMTRPADRGPCRRTRSGPSVLAHADAPSATSGTGGLPSPVLEPEVPLEADVADLLCRSRGYVLPGEVNARSGS